MEEFDREAVLNNGGWITDYCFQPVWGIPFRLVKMQDPLTYVNVLAQYNPNLVAYVGARNWNKFKCKQD